MMMMVLFHRLRIALLITIIGNWFDGNGPIIVDSGLPIGSIIKDTIGAFGRLGGNIKARMQYEQPRNGIQVINVVKDALVDDYVQNHDTRVQKMCEYLRQGRIYKGPCPQESSLGYDTSSGETIRYVQPSDGEVVSEIRNINPSDYPSGSNDYPTGSKDYPTISRDYQTGSQPEVVEDKTVVVIRPQKGQRIRIKVPDGRPRGPLPPGPPPPGPPPPGPPPGRPQIIEETIEEYVDPETVAKKERDTDDDDDDVDGGDNDDDDGKRRNNRRNRPRIPNRNRKNQPKNNQQNQKTPCQTNDGAAGECMPASFCYSQHGSVERYRANICQRTNGISGICCVKKLRIEDSYDIPIRIPKVSKPTMNVAFISLDDINNAAKEANKFIDEYIERERQLVQHGMVQERGSMQAMHQAFFGEFDPAQFQLTKGGFINLVTTSVIKRKFKLTNEQARDGLHKYSIENTDLEQYCIPEPTCRQGKYRTMDGSCNNLQRPIWAKSNTAFERLLPPAYDDGLHEPRTLSVNGNPLPSARVVSVQTARNQNLPDPQYTLMIMQWGQFLDHDLTLAASTRAATGQGLICCHPQTQRKVEHHACFPIRIPEQDQFYSRFNQKCMDFVRNSPAPRSGCSLGHREQMNILTHVIDGSMVYGSTIKKSKSLRLFRGGKLRWSDINNQVSLPFEAANSTGDCALSEQEQRRFKCFDAGDGRVNEQTGLTMMHTLLFREHNRVADRLARINPKWNDEVLFQEARRIVAAEIQHITYNEWLPIILGRTTMKHFGLIPQSFGFIDEYSPKINPNILNEFATAAYRLHSLIQGTFQLMDNNGQVTHTINLHETFNKPKTMYLPNAFDQYLNGFTVVPSQKWDGFFTDKITNHLFHEERRGFGMDLIALNIQRGRDHGLQGYNRFRQICGQQAVNSFQELDAYMEPGSAQAFSKVYADVNDIDLFIGGVHEKPLPDALVGPTLACIIGEQFRRLKAGDRFFYENGALPHSFSPRQLQNIRRASLASLICDNADNIPVVQPLAFLRPGGWNQKVSCEKIERVNFQPWKNEKLWS